MCLGNGKEIFIFGHLRWISNFKEYSICGRRVYQKKISKWKSFYHRLGISIPMIKSRLKNFSEMPSKDFIKEKLLILLII